QLEATLGQHECGFLERRADDGHLRDTGRKRWRAVVPDAQQRKRGVQTRRSLGTSRLLTAPIRRPDPNLSAACGANGDLAPSLVFHRAARRFGQFCGLCLRLGSRYRQLNREPDDRPRQRIGGLADLLLEGLDFSRCRDETSLAGETLDGLEALLKLVLDLCK